MNVHLVTLSSLLAAASLAAQTSLATTTIDQTGVGCQSATGLLTGGVAASAGITVAYDAATGVLELTVDNTTPVVAGEATGVITEICLNLPPGAITSATLASQVGSGGETPAFALSFDADTSASPNPNSTACLGSFNLCLDNGAGVAGSIANAAATQIGAPNPVLGPVTFTLQLTGPGVGGIDAEAILASFSAGGAQPTNVGLKFQAAGIGGQESGFIGSGDTCRTAVYTVGPTAVGQTFDLCVTGDFGCHVCVWVSEVPGPFVVGPFVIPIGLPTAAVFDLGNLGLGNTGPAACVTITVPNDPMLAGYTLYVANLTFFQPNPTSLAFSPAYTLVIQ